MMKQTKAIQQALVKSFLLSTLTLVLAACGGGGSGTGVDTDPDNASTAQSGSNNTETRSPRQEYLNRSDAEQPDSDDVQAFMVHFWDNVAADNRCGQCHNDSHDEPFARTDNINEAYNATLPLINRTSPQSSALVSKVEGGHQCWQSSDSACAQILTRWIQNWVNDGAGSGESSTTIVLEKPDEIDITSSKVLPGEYPATFTQMGGLHDLLTTYCSDCHTEEAVMPIAPYFATSDPQSSWDAARSRIDVNDENRTAAQAQSRFVVRLYSEFHNCWDDCDDDAEELLAAIQNIAAGIEVEEIDESLRISGGMILTEGTVASSGGRFEQYQIAFWNFSTGDGNVAYDTSGVEPAMNLSLTGKIDWVGGWGIDFDPADGAAARAWADTTSSKKLYDAITLSGEYTIEAWVAPDNVTQEDAQIVSYANGSESRNMVMSQTLYNYDFYQRTNIDTDATNNLSTNDDDERAQATLQHVVMTYDRENGRRIYVNGEYTGDEDPVTPGFLTNWSEDYVFSMGNDANNSADRQWRGMVRMAAIHSRALSQEQVLQNYDVGVGQKYYLLFDVTDLVTIDDCYSSYIVFEAAQLDNYAYRFNNPFFARLYEAQPEGTAPAECTADTAPAQDNYSFSVTDIRIGINGKVAEVGQAFRNVGRDEAGNQEGFTIDSASNADGYQQIANIGTVLSLENGPVEDLFFLAFGSINGLAGATTDPAAISVENPIAAAESPDFGLRTFEEINASMSDMTGIPTTNGNVESVYNDVKTQLPTNELAETFLAAHQIAVAQMAITYCSELVNQEVGMAPGSRRFFTNFDFDETPGNAFIDNAARDTVYDPLIDLTVGTSLNDQPSVADIKTNFDTLLDGYNGGGTARSGLLDCGADCTATRTQTIVKSLCAASLGSGMMLIQ